MASKNGKNRTTKTAPNKLNSSFTTNCAQNHFCAIQQQRGGCWATNDSQRHFC